MSNHSLYPMGMALIMGANQTTENIGKQVRLLQFVKPTEVVAATFSGHRYEFHGGFTGVWVVKGEDLIRNDVDKGPMGDLLAACEPGHLLSLAGIRPLVQKHL